MAACEAPFVTKHATLAAGETREREKKTRPSARLVRPSAGGVGDSQPLAPSQVHDGRLVQHLETGRPANAGVVPRTLEPVPRHERGITAVLRNGALAAVGEVAAHRCPESNADVPVVILEPNGHSQVPRQVRLVPSGEVSKAGIVSARGVVRILREVRGDAWGGSYQVHRGVAANPLSHDERIDRPAPA